MKRHRFSCRLSELVRAEQSACPFWGSTRLTFGADTTLEAEDVARAFIAESYRWAGSTGEFRIEISEPCAACGVTGVKAGCKRKPCPWCKGSGANLYTTLYVNRPMEEAS